MASLRKAVCCQGPDVPLSPLLQAGVLPMAASGWFGTLCHPSGPAGSARLTMQALRLRQRPPLAFRKKSCFSEGFSHRKARAGLPRPPLRPQAAPAEAQGAPRLCCRQHRGRAELPSRAFPVPRRGQRWRPGLQGPGGRQGLGDGRAPRGLETLSCALPCKEPQTRLRPHASLAHSSSRSSVPCIFSSGELGLPQGRRRVTKRQVATGILGAGGHWRGDRRNAAPLERPLGTAPRI